MKFFFEKLKPKKQETGLTRKPTIESNTESTHKTISIWETSHWQLRLQECILARDKKAKTGQSIHIDLSAKSGLDRIPDKEMPDVIQRLVSVIQEHRSKYPFDKFDLDLSGHHLQSSESIYVISDLIKDEENMIRSLNISKNNFSGFVSLAHMGNALLETKTLIEIDVSHMNFSKEIGIGDYINEPLQKNGKLKIVNGYDKAMTNFDKVGFIKHKHPWQDFSCQLDAETGRKHVNFNLSDHLMAEYEMSEIMAWLGQWCKNHPTINVSLNFSNNNLRSEDVRLLIDLIKENSSIKGLDVSNNPLDDTSCIYLDELLRSGTGLESITFRDTNKEIKKYINQAIEEGIKKGNSSIKYVNGYALSTIDLSKIDYCAKNDNEFDNVLMPPLRKNNPK